MANTEPFLFFWKRVETKERKLLSVALGTYFKHHLLTFTGPAKQDSFTNILKVNMKIQGVSRFLAGNQLYDF